MRNFVVNLLLVMSFLLMTGGAFVLGGAFGWEGFFSSFSGLGAIIAFLIGVVFFIGAHENSAKADVSCGWAIWAYLARRTNRRRFDAVAGAAIWLVALAVALVAPQNKVLVGVAVMIATASWTWQLLLAGAELSIWQREEEEFRRKMAEYHGA